LGFELSETELNNAFIQFKEMANRKKEITDRDLEAIVNDEIDTVPDHFRLELVQVSCGNNARPTATVTIRTPDGSELSDAAIGSRSGGCSLQSDSIEWCRFLTN
jgi:2-isopropylmalate synthase